MRPFTLLLSILLLSACSTEGLKHYNTTSKLQKNSTHIRDTNSVKRSLYNAYKKWKNTPYCYGGLSQNGIDCSGLVQKIYKDAFNIRLPRTTQAQSKVGYRVSKREIKEGDLIFFKTGYKTHHSGIYLENGNFINTSSKKGVTISNINNPYWRSKYWQTRRVLPAN